MNIRLSILLVLVLLVFGGTYLIIQLTRSDPPRETDPWLYNIDSDDVVRVSVSYDGQTVVYQQKPGSRDWVIQGEQEILVFPPKWAGILLLLSGPQVPVLADTISNPGQFGLEPPVTAVTVSDRSGNVVEFHLGDATPDTERNYASLVGNPELFTVPMSMTDVVNGLVTNPPYFQLFQVDAENLEFIEVTSNDQTSAYFKDRDTGQWFIRADPIGQSPQVFPDEWGDTPEFISGPRADLAAETVDDPAMYGLETPHASVGLRVLGTGVTQFQLGSLTDDGRYRYARILDDPRLFLVEARTADRISALATDPPYPPGIVPESEDGE